MGARIDLPRIHLPLLSACPSDYPDGGMGYSVTDVRPVLSPHRPGAEATHRFRFIDGLRGVAATTVMVFHFFAGSDYQASLNQVIPGIIHQILRNGYLGVEIFFVLSGFVMAHSQRNARIDLRFLGNFALRRSLRLDPAYWLTIFLVLAINFAHVHLLHDGLGRVLTPRTTLASMFYLQLFLKTGGLIDVAWTLCYEVQFYLVLSVLTGLAQWLFERSNGRLSQPRWGWREPGRLLIFGPLAIASFIPFQLYFHTSGLFIEYWYMFFLGTLAQWVYDRRVSARWFIGYAGVTAICLSGGGGFPRIAALVTAIVIFGVAQRHRLDALLTWSPLQFLGKISYSLYLLHSVLIGVILEAGRALTGHSPASIFSWTCAAVPITLLIATGMYYAVEKPGVALGKRLRRRVLDSIPRAGTDALLA